jgi:hypothetical protein
MDGVVVFAPVADFQKRHAGPVDLQNGLTGLFENGNGMDRGTGAEIVDTSHGFSSGSI